MSKEMRKGEHEDATEKAKELLDKGVGITKIRQVTNLSEKDVKKVKDKMVDMS
ncbi:MAG: hypothetical protein Q8936_09190 [Bacillota bacterium]|nr:hypothetical protein [Bacillota bacterium]